MGKDELDEKYFDRLLKELPQSLVEPKIVRIRKKNQLTTVLSKYVGKFIERKLIGINRKWGGYSLYLTPSSHIFVLVR